MATQKTEVGTLVEELDVTTLSHVAKLAHF